MSGAFFGSREWRRLARIAVEAMVVEAMPLLGVSDATHVVGNVTAPWFLEPEVDADVARRFRAALEVVASGMEAGKRNRLALKLASLWWSAERGETVPTPALDELHERVRARPERYTFRSRYSAGFWEIAFQAPDGRDVARGIHPMQAVAAALCLEKLGTLGALPAE